MAEKKFHTKLDKGILSSHLAKQILDHLSTMGDKSVVITVKEQKRSISQNALWFARLEYVIPNLRQYGDNWTAEKLHEEIVKELGYVETLHFPNGMSKTVRKETKKMDKKEFSEMIERAEAYLASIGIFLPPARMMGY